MPGCIRDAAPDAWGRRVLINTLLGISGPRADTTQLDELTYLLESGSDRAGALDFQASATEYVPRQGVNATMTELLEAAARVEQGVPLTQELAEALQHGSAIGGAGPKALMRGIMPAFRDGGHLTLTPAYDICPQARAGNGFAGDADRRKRQPE